MGKKREEIIATQQTKMMGFDAPLDFESDDALPPDTRKR